MQFITAFLMVLFLVTPRPGQFAAAAEFTYVYDGDLYSLHLSEDTWHTENLTKYFSPSAEFPVWSPNGRHLAFLATDAGGTSLYTMDTEGQFTELVAELPYVGSLVWSPTSTMLAYTTRSTGKMANQLHIQNLATSDSLDLPNNVAGCCVSWLTPTTVAYIGEPSWSPHYLDFDQLAEPKRIPWREYHHVSVIQDHIWSSSWDKRLTVTHREADSSNQYLAVILYGVRQSASGRVPSPRLIIYDADLKEVTAITDIGQDRGSWRPLNRG